MLTFPLVRTSLQKVTVLWVVDGHVALSVEVTGHGIAKVDQERPACDFFEVSTSSGTRLYVLAVTEHSSRRIRFLGATAR